MKTILYLVLLVAAAGYYGSEATGPPRTTNAEHGWTDDDYATDDHEGWTTDDYEGWTTHEYDDYKGWVSCGCHDAPSCRQCGTQQHLCNGDCTWACSGTCGCHPINGPGPSRPPPRPTGETPVSMGTRPPPTWETPVHISRPHPTGESRPPPSRPSRPPPTEPDTDGTTAEGNKCGKKTCETAGERNKNEQPSDCLTGIMASEECTRHIKFCNNSATFIGEKNHELWWDPNNLYWFCGMGKRDGMKELNENGITMPFNLSSAVNNLYYKTECPRKAIFSKDQYKVRMEYACLNTTQQNTSLPFVCLNNTDYSRPGLTTDYIMLIVEGKNDPMDLAPRGHGLNWDEYKEVIYHVNLEIDIYENITGYHLNDTLWKADFPPPVGAIPPIS